MDCQSNIRDELSNAQPLNALQNLKLVKLFYHNQTTTIGQI